MSFFVDPRKKNANSSFFDALRAIRSFVFTYYRGKKRVKRSIEKQVSVGSHQENNQNLSRILDIGSRILKFFLVGKKTLLRVTSNRIDEETDPNYLKIRVNHDFLYEGSSKYDVLEQLFINEQFILNKKRRVFEKNLPKLSLKLKKNDNYFVDFLSYITKKKKVQIKSFKKSFLMSNYVKKNEKSVAESPNRSRGTTDFHLSPSRKTIQDSTKKSFTEFVEAEDISRNRILLKFY